MDILLVCGFLGGGKTTVVNSLLRGMDAGGITAAVIENEIGENGIDDQAIGGGVRVVPLFGGCVCCQISGSFIGAVDKIQQEVNPDWIIAELTGLALPGPLAETLDQYGPAGVRVHTLAIADASRFSQLLFACEPLIRNQLECADLVLVNKIDIAPPDEALLRQIAGYSGTAPILPVSAAGGDTLWPAVYARLKEETA